MPNIAPYRFNPASGDPDNPDDPEDLVRRDHAAVACIAALAPANAVEADLAAQFFAASEQGRDWLRRAQLPGTTLETALKYRRQAVRMMREGRSALGRLLRLQNGRRKQEADRAAPDHATRPVTRSVVSFSDLMSRNT